MPDLIKSKGNCMTCGELFFYDVPRNVWDIETHCSQTCWDYYFLGENKPFQTNDMKFIEESGI